jgi:hypothetical protein
MRDLDAIGGKADMPRASGLYRCGENGPNSDIELPLLLRCTGLTCYT